MDRHFGIADVAGAPLADRLEKPIFIERRDVVIPQGRLTEMSSLAMILPDCMGVTLDTL